jgi:heme-degrading monooxygenase HmoA
VFAAIFELQPEQGKVDEYLSRTEFLCPKLEAIDGFVEIDLFAIDRTSARVLPVSTWRDGKAAVRWRTQGDHQAVQDKGRFEVLTLGVGEVISGDAPPPGLRSWNNASMRPKQAGRRSSP